MNKNDLNFNLNTIPTAAGSVAGSGISTTLSMLPFVFAHPNLQHLVFLIFAGGISYEMYNLVKQRNLNNKKLLEANKIKDYKNPVNWAFACGLFGFQALNFIPESIINHQTYQIIASALSGGAFATSVFGLVKNIQHNKQIINKAR